MNNVLVLDTHIWIYLLNGDEKIKHSKILSCINNSIKSNMLKISAISLWEVAMLTSKGRIVLSENTLDWINNAVSAPGISIEPLTPEIAYESTVLPGVFHGDPADRIIVATARILNAILLTFDKEIIKYSKNGYVKIVE